MTEEEVAEWAHRAREERLYKLAARIEEWYAFQRLSKHCAPMWAMHEREREERWRREQAELEERLRWVAEENARRGWEPKEKISRSEKRKAKRLVTMGCSHVGWWRKIFSTKSCPKCTENRRYVLRCPGCNVEACAACQIGMRPVQPEKPEKVERRPRRATRRPVSKEHCDPDFEGKHDIPDGSDGVYGADHEYEEYV